MSSSGPEVLFELNQRFLASYRSDCQNWGSVSGTLTVFFSNIHLFINSIQEKFTNIRVSAVIPSLDGWIQHSVPHGKLL